MYVRVFCLCCVAFCFVLLCLCLFACDCCLCMRLFCLFTLCVTFLVGLLLVFFKEASVIELFFSFYFFCVKEEMRTNTKVQERIWPNIGITNSTLFCSLYIIIDV